MKDMNFYKKMVFIALLSVVTCNNAMNEQSMQLISSEKDIPLFVSKVVAYTTCSSLLGKKGGYTLSDPEIKYGYIENKGNGNRQMKDVLYGDMMTTKFLYNMFPDIDKNYILHQVRRENIDIPFWRELTNDHISEGLMMRDINQAEANAILLEMKLGKVKFDYLDNEFSLFDKIITFLKKSS